MVVKMWKIVFGTIFLICICRVRSLEGSDSSDESKDVDQDGRRYFHHHHRHHNHHDSRYLRKPFNGEEPDPPFNNHPIDTHPVDTHLVNNHPVDNHPLRVLLPNLLRLRTGKNQLEGIQTSKDNPGSESAPGRVLPEQASSGRPLKVDDEKSEDLDVYVRSIKDLVSGKEKFRSDGDRILEVPSIFLDEDETRKNMIRYGTNEEISRFENEQAEKNRGVKTDETKRVESGGFEGKNDRHEGKNGRFHPKGLRSGYKNHIRVFDGHTDNLKYLRSTPKGRSIKNLAVSSPKMIGPNQKTSRSKQPKPASRKKSQKLEIPTIFKDETLRSGKALSKPDKTGRGQSILSSLDTHQQFHLGGSPDITPPVIFKDDDVPIRSFRLSRLRPPAIMKVEKRLLDQPVQKGGKGGRNGKYTIGGTNSRYRFQPKHFRNTIDNVKKISRKNVKNNEKKASRFGSYLIWPQYRRTDLLDVDHIMDENDDDDDDVPVVKDIMDSPRRILWKPSQLQYHNLRRAPSLRILNAGIENTNNTDNIDNTNNDKGSKNSDEKPTKIVDEKETNGPDPKSMNDVKLRVFGNNVRYKEDQEVAARILRHMPSFIYFDNEDRSNDDLD